MPNRPAFVTIRWKQAERLLLAAEQVAHTADDVAAQGGVPDTAPLEAAVEELDPLLVWLRPMVYAETFTVHKAGAK